MKYNVIYFETLNSTNDYGKENIEVLNHLDIIFTKNQVKGHGRMTRVWSSNNDGLTFSIVLKDKFIYDNYSTLSLLSAVSVYKVLSKYSNNVSIKWPNDVYINDKKVCGILMESIIYTEMEGIILGIGVNVNTKEFSLDTATSLYLETNITYDIESIRDQIIDTLVSEIELVKNNDTSYIETINEHNFLFNKDAYAFINGNKELVKVGNILPNNKLEVFLNNKKHEVFVDEITLAK